MAACAPLYTRCRQSPQQQHLPQSAYIWGATLAGVPHHRALVDHQNHTAFFLPFWRVAYPLSINTAYIT